MKYSKVSQQQVSFTGDRSIAETLLETLGQRPDFEAPAKRRRSRKGQVVVAVIMLVAIAVVSYAFLRPGQDFLPAAGDPVAFLEVVRGSVWSGSQLHDSASTMPAAVSSGASGLLTLSAGQPIHAGAVLTTASLGDGVAGRAAFRLAGGQSMRLDADTQVRVTSERGLELQRGAIYIDSNAGASVEVRTTLGVVRDIGTQFEVRLEGSSPDVADLRVRVREGSIVLETGGESHHAVVGEELSLTADGALSRATSSIYGPHWDWVLDTAQTPAVAGQTLNDFLGWVSREGGWNVRYADPAIADVAAEAVLHGDIQNLSLSQAASMALDSSNLAYRVEGGDFIVGPKSAAE